MADLCPLDAFGELCFHALAHMPMRDAGSSFAPDYLAWAEAQGLSESSARADGSCIAQSVRATGRDLLHAWPRLHRTLAAAMRTRARPLADLDPTDVDDPVMLAAIQRAHDPALELMHTLVGLALPQWTLVHAQQIAPALCEACDRLTPLLARACAHVPSLTGQRIELSWVLGPRGRAHPERLIIGAPASWHHGSDAQTIVIALHEHAVRDLATGDWATVEWSALRRVSAWLAGEQGDLERVHAAWLASLELRALVESVHARGTIDDAIAERLLAAPDERAHVLAGLATD